MVDAITSTSSNLATNLVKTAYDLIIEGANRQRVSFRQLVDKHPAQLSNAGSTVVLQIYGDIPVQKAALDEIIDPDFVTPPATTTVTITLAERGMVVQDTLKFEQFSLSNIDPYLAEQVGWNQMATINELVRDELSNATNVVAGGSGSHNATIADVQGIVNTFVNNAAAPKLGELYAAYIHPDVSLDIRTQVGTNSFTELHKYTSSDVFWPGQLGVIERCFFVETATCLKVAGTPPTYETYFLGAQALAEAVAIEPGVRFGVVADRLKRKYTIGWYGLLGHKIYRSTNVRKLTSTAKITGGVA